MWAVLQQVFHTLILVWPTCLHFILVWVHIMQQNFSKEFSRVVWLVVFLSGYGKGHTYRGLIIHYCTRALAQHWPIIINLLLTTLGEQVLHSLTFFTLTFKLRSPKKLIFSWLELDVKIHLLCAFNPHFHPLTCRHHNETPPSTTFITEYIICSHRGIESSAVQIGTACRVVSHLEATQAGEKIRGDMRERCRM